MHSMKPIWRGKKNITFNLIIPHYISVKQKSHSLFFLRHSPKESPNKTSRAKYSPFQEKKSLTLWCKLNCWLWKPLASAARRVQWAAEPRPTSILQVQLIPLGNLKSYSKKTGFRALRYLQSSRINFLVNSYVKSFGLSLHHRGTEAELLLEHGGAWPTPQPPQHGPAITLSRSGILHQVTPG